MWNRIKEILGRVVGRPGGRNLPMWCASELSSPFAVPNAVPWMLCAQRADREEVAALLASLMRKLERADWGSLYLGFRYTEIHLSQVALLASLPPDSAVEMLGVATLNANGRVRETALRALGELGHRRAVPYVLLRLSDWVAEVRAAAQSVLRGLMQGGIARELLEYHYLIERLELVQRANLSLVLSDIGRRLRSPENRSALLEALDSPRVGQRLFAYEMLSILSQHDLMERAACDPSPRVRLWLVGQLSEAQIAENPRLLIMLAHDKAISVSAAAVARLSPEQIELFRDDILELAFAPARSVRLAARYALREKSIDWAAECRIRVEQAGADDIAPGVVACLGEVGTKSDCAIVERLLKSKRPRVREEAVVAAMRLDKASAIGRVVPMLSDTNGRVRRAVFSLIATEPLQQWMPMIRDMLESGSAREQKLALQLRAAQGGWGIVPDLLGALGSQYEEVRQLARDQISSWYLRYSACGWIKPSKDDCVALRSRLVQMDRGSLSPPEEQASCWQQFRAWIEEELRAAGQ